MDYHLYKYLRSQLLANSSYDCPLAVVHLAPLSGQLSAKAGQDHRNQCNGTQLNPRKPRAKKKRKELVLTSSTRMFYTRQYPLCLPTVMPTYRVLVPTTKGRCELRGPPIARDFLALSYSEEKKLRSSWLAVQYRWPPSNPGQATELLPLISLRSRLRQPPP